MKSSGCKLTIQIMLEISIAFSLKEPGVKPERKQDLTLTYISTKKSK